MGLSGNDALLTSTTEIGRVGELEKDLRYGRREGQHYSEIKKISDIACF